MNVTAPLSVRGAFCAVALACAVQAAPTVVHAADGPRQGAPQVSSDAQEQYARRFATLNDVAQHPCLVPIFTQLSRRADSDERYRASIALPVGANAAFGGDGSTLDLVIERWSSVETQESMAAALLAGSRNAPLDVLRQAETVGYVKGMNASGYDLHFAHQQPLGDGARRIIVATNRGIGMWEGRGVAAAEPPFSFIELTVNRDGDGLGLVAMAGEVTVNRRTGQIELMNTPPPLSLRNVRKRAPEVP